MLTSIKIDAELATQLDVLAQEYASSVDAVLASLLAQNQTPSGTLFSLILSGISDAVFLTNDSGEFQWVCPNMHKIFGYSRAEVQQMGTIERLLGTRIIDPSSLPAGAEVTNIEHTIIDKYNERHVLWINVKRVEIGAGTLLYSCRDITERKAVEDELARTQALLQAAIEQCPAGIQIADAPNCAIRLANAAAAEIVGQPQHLQTQVSLDNLEMLQWDNFYPDGTPYEIENLPLSRAILHGQTSTDVEILVRRADGDERWILTNAGPVYDAEGNIIAGVVVFSDNTERKRALDELRTAETHFRTLLEHSSDFIAIADAQGYPVVFNDAYAQLIGQVLGVEMRPGLKPHRLLDDPDQMAWWEDLYQRVLGGEALREEFAHSVGDQLRWFEVDFKPIILDGLVTGVLEISRDITDRKEAEQQRLKLAIEQERVGLLAEFIEGALHEFRTPLSTIQVDVYSLEAVLLSEREQQLVRRIRRQAQSISALVESLATMAKLDASSSDDPTTTVNLNVVVRTTSTHMDNAMRAQGLALELVLDETLPLVPGDSQHLHLALQAVVDNAIRYTPDGTITLRTYRTNRDAVIEVQDTGVGIDSADLSHIFERFWRKDKARTTRGFGLGLPIARKVMEEHGGRILVESSPGQGSIVRLLFPLA